MAAGMTLATSCATVGKRFDMSKVDRLEVGTSRMAEVESWFGKPLVVIDVPNWKYRRAHFGDEKAVTIWRYVFAIGTIGYAQGKSLQVEFDRTGTVSDYYYDGDGTPGPKETKDFDFFRAKATIVPGTTTQAEVLTVLGDNYRKIPMRKPSTHERWHYGHTQKAKDAKTGTWTSLGPVEINKIYGKSLAVDFDAKGIVIDVRGESDFPEDKEKVYAR